MFKPDFVRLESYEDVESIKKSFGALSEINQESHVLNGGSFFVIRVHGLDNIHRAMKYGVWTR